MRVQTLTTPHGDSIGEVRKTLAMLGAFAMFLSTIDFMIPKPIPTMRIGLANLPLMLALDMFPFRIFLVLVALKVAGQALVTGTLFSPIFLFSLAGTTLAASSMYGLRRLCGTKRISFVGLGTLGAMVSNSVQLVMASLWLMGGSARFIAPFYFAAGLISGVTLGAFCEAFTRRSRWYAERRIR